MNKIDGIPIDDLTREFGSPLFAASASTIINNCHSFRAAFSSVYPDIEVAYSYKVNSVPAILGIIHGEGAWAEAASGFEYELARRMGVPGSFVVFNGPYKKKEELARAINEGALINADHLEEIELIEEIAREEKRTVEIGIRVSMETGIDQMPDRFGFSIEQGDAERAVERASRHKLLRIAGLHVHLTSYIVEPHEEGGIPARHVRLIWPKDPGAYRKAADEVTRFSMEMKEKFGVRMKYIDMGGGFPTVGSLAPYVEAVTGPILTGFGSEDPPILILEPGRAIVSDALHLVTTVVAVKELRGGVRAVVVDSGINILPTSFWKFQDIECAEERGGDLRDATVYGPLCLQTDIIGKCMLPDLKAGDRLVAKNVGAYNIPQSTTFIFPRPPIVLIEEGRARIIRRGETSDDVFPE
ncbi:MAG TPA: alanine racemase [Thermodesulfobacteriota bacterium]|nr:alanine racemase [Thermodesulfobacteriota bacterium]